MNAYVVRIDRTNGAPVRGWRMGPSAQWSGGALGGIWGNSIAVDEENNIYVTGGFYGTVYMDPDTTNQQQGWGYGPLSAVGWRELYVWKWNGGAAKVEWYRGSTSINNASMADGVDVAVDGCGNVYVAGVYKPMQVFIDTVSLSTTTNSTEPLVYKVAYWGCPSCQLVRACTSYEPPSGTKVWSQSGVYWDTVGGGNSDPLCSEVTRYVVTIDPTVEVFLNPQWEGDTINLYCDYLIEAYPDGGAFTFSQGGSPLPPGVVLWGRKAPSLYSFASSASGWITYTYHYENEEGCWGQASGQVYVGSSGGGGGLSGPCAPWKVVPERPSEPATQRQPVRVMVREEVAEVYLTDKHLTPYRYGVYDVHGRLLRSGKLTAMGDRYGVPLAELPAGVYLLTLPEVGFYGRVVKMR